MRDLTVGVAILTLNAAEYLHRSVPPLLQSEVRPRVLVVDSSSTDGTIETARGLGAETLTIPRNEFNHGLTREKARRELATDVVIMMTQDAYTDDAELLQKLLAPLRTSAASVSYARQVPCEPAAFFERFPRLFNYPPESCIKAFDDFDRIGVYACFCSNSCAAWMNEALDKIGGFPAVLTNEDQYAAAMLLKKGHKIAYVAEAVVRHSHRYTLWQEFQRHFDTGYERSRFLDVIGAIGADERRGRLYVRHMLRQLASEAPASLLYAPFHVFAKWAGYRIGSRAHPLPVWLKKQLSAQKYYWKQQAGT